MPAGRIRACCPSLTPETVAKGRSIDHPAAGGNADGRNRRRLSRSTRPLPGKPPCPEFRPFALSATYAQTLAEFCVPRAGRAGPQAGAPNRELAEELGADPDLLAGPEGPCSPRQPAAGRRQAGRPGLRRRHQFGGFSPRLGDGRACCSARSSTRQGRRRDIAFKGLGAPLSRAMATASARWARHRANSWSAKQCTRSASRPRRHWPWSLPSTWWCRDRALPGAVLTRIAASHLRVGTFEYVAVASRPGRQDKLADYAIARHDPDLVGRADRYYAARRRRCHADLSGVGCLSMASVSQSDE